MTKQATQGTRDTLRTIDKSRGGNFDRERTPQRDAGKPMPEGQQRVGRS